VTVHLLHTYTGHNQLQVYTYLLILRIAYLMNFNNLCNGDIDDWFGDARNVCELVNVEPMLRLLNTTYGCKELPSAATHTHLTLTTINNHCPLPAQFVC